MKPYIIKRILSAIPLLVIISFVCFVFINLIPSDPAEVALRVRQVPIIKGDAKSVSIAAASILAKVTRDHMMVEYDTLFPEYGFAKHKGYGSKEHFAALRELGPCPMHRKTFRGVLPEQQTARQGSLL